METGMHLVYRDLLRRRNRPRLGTRAAVRVLAGLALLGTVLLFGISCRSMGAGTALTSTTARLVVLPSLGTDTVAEVRVLDRTIRLGQTLEVVFQWQQPAPLPNLTNRTESLEAPSAPSVDRRWGWTGPPWAKAGDWDVHIDVQEADLSRIVGEDSRRHFLDAGFQVYTLRPRRAGPLAITEKVFRVFPVAHAFSRLPRVFALDTITIQVDEGADVGSGALGGANDAIKR